MVDVKDGMKYWRDAGHVARRTLEATKDVLTVGTPWKDVIEFAERHIHRHGGSPAFPTTIGVNEIAAHFTPDHSNLEPQDWEGDMVLKNGDLVKIDVGVHIKGHIGDNALTFEVGNKNNHTDQIKAAREARDASIELMHPVLLGTKLEQQQAKLAKMLDSNRSEICVVISSNLGSYTQGFRSPHMLAVKKIKASVAPLSLGQYMLLNLSIPQANQV